MAVVCGRINHLVSLTGNQEDLLVRTIKHEMELFFYFQMRILSPLYSLASFPVTAYSHKTIHLISLTLFPRNTWRTLSPSRQVDPSLLWKPRPIYSTNNAYKCCHYLFRHIVLFPPFKVHST